MRKIALITGVGGQDGSYLAELLLEKGYDIHGIIRRTSQFNRNRIEKTRNLAQKMGQKFELHYGDMGDSANLYRIIFKCKPTEIYNLASQSHVAISFEEPAYTTDINANGVLRLLDGIRHADINCRFYQASTSELFGKVSESPQDENTKFYPRSPYGVSKLYAYWIVKNYRESYGIHSSNGILFNHESPRRGENFVTRKITYSLAKIKFGMQNVLRLGNLDAHRDWGYAKDYVRAMWLILQQEKADDYIIATGKTHSVREFINKAALIAGFKLEWHGKGVHEVGKDIKTGKVIVEIDPRHYRPAEVEITCGNATKAREVLGWKPEVSFDQLVEIMMVKDLNLISSSLNNHTPF